MLIFPWGGGGGHALKFIKESSVCKTDDRKQTYVCYALQVTAMVHAKCLVRMEMALNYTAQTNVWLWESSTDLRAYPRGWQG